MLAAPGNNRSADGCWRIDGHPFRELIIRRRLINPCQEALLATSRRPSGDGKAHSEARDTGEALAAVAFKKLAEPTWYV